MLDRLIVDSGGVHSTAEFEQLTRPREVGFGTGVWDRTSVAGVVGEVRRIARVVPNWRATLETLCFFGVEGAEVWAGECGGQGGFAMEDELGGFDHDVRIVLHLARGTTKAGFADAVDEYAIGVGVGKGRRRTSEEMAEWRAEWEGCVRVVAEGDGGWCAHAGEWGT